ncbi:MAG: hypothetical protein VKJ02_01490 [Snowella sp.]|nr:hypothetical protein [Snowella sp.]
MSRSLPSIEEKVIKLEDDTVVFFKEFQPFYRQYLKLLGQAVEHQLILAAHHICTQIYPDAFLRLTFNQRQRLQERLRQLGRQFENYLFAALQGQADLLRDEQEDISTDTDSETMGESIPHNAQSVSESDLLPSETSQNLTSKAPISIKNPEHLLQWGTQVDQEIQDTLEKISKEANALLQGAAILSNKFPPKILEMALQAEENGMAIGRSGMPNILNLVIEATAESSSSEEEENLEPENVMVAKITAIHLRLTEIEFSHPDLNHARKQLRNSLEQLGKLRKQYRQLQREYRIVEAEQAWRSSWVEN